jgi:small GTP-binding protein
MPANLNAESKTKWKRYLLEKRPEAKIKALEDFYSSIPKHKGNEKLRANIKRKISNLKIEIENKKKRSSRSSGYGTSLKKTGAAQIVILGHTNVGKSSLLAALTNAKPQIANYEYTTTKPIQGMLRFENLSFQLIEAPAIMPKNAENKAWNAQTLNLARNSDGLILILDISNNPASQLNKIIDNLDDFGISIFKPKFEVEIRSEKVRGIQIMLSGKLINCDLNDVIKLAQSYGMRNALLKIFGDTRLEDIENALLENKRIYRPAIILANKIDRTNKGKEDLKIRIRGHIPLLTISCESKINLEEIAPTIFKTLGIIRVYTKEPGVRPASNMPFILKSGSSIFRLAKEIHSDFFKNLKYARIWGPSSKYPGEKVGGTHTLKDGDTVEIHAN